MGTSLLRMVGFLMRLVLGLLGYQSLPPLPPSLGLPLPSHLLQAQPGTEGDPYEAEDFVCDYHLEMLSLSQDQQNPSCIQFDDSNWQLHLTSLKPLGLNVLLNLCNASVTERLCRFSDHLCNIALQESHSAVLPVHVPWGLCELARLIGTARRALWCWGGTT